MTNERFTLNAKVLNQLQETLLTSKKHVEFLAANAPEIRTNLQSIAETLETVVSVLENQIYFNRDNAAIVEKLNGKFELEKSCKNQAYDKKRVVILLASKAQRKGGNNQVAAFLFVLPCSYSIYTPSDKAVYIISCSSVSISAVWIGVTSSNTLNPLKSPKMPVCLSLFRPLLALSYHLQ